MRAHRPSAEPATAAKVCDLVALHHGAPGEPSPTLRKRQPSSFRPGRIWLQEAKRNHLVARRRRVPFDRISPDCFPVVLELSGSGQLVILNEKGEPSASGEETYIVQFPDSRESLVHAGRLKSLYSGTCIMLRPEERRPFPASERLWHRVKRRFAR